jgi:hypothetical protein
MFVDRLGFVQHRERLVDAHSCPNRGFETAAELLITAWAADKNRGLETLL